MLAYEGEHGFFNTIAETGYFYIAMDDNVAVRVKPGGKHVTDYDAAREYGKAFGHTHVTMDNAAYDRRPGNERSVTTRTFTDHNLAGGPYGTTKITIDTYETFYYEVAAEGTCRTEEGVDEDIAGCGHCCMVSGDR